MGEITCIGLGLEGKPPELKWVRKAPNEDESDGKAHFAIDGELIVPGKIKLIISTVYYLKSLIGNYNFPVKLEIIVSRITGSIRLQYSNDPDKGSFLQFLTKPAISVEVEPLAGEVSKVNLKNIPTVKGIIKGKVNKAIEELCFPSRLKMEVPCVFESPQLDEKGKIIEVKKITPRNKKVKRSSTHRSIELDKVDERSKRRRKSTRF